MQSAASAEIPVTQQRAEISVPSLSYVPVWLTTVQIPEVRVAMIKEKENTFKNILNN